MGDPLTLEVECLSDSAYANRPLAVCVDGKRRQVRKMLDEQCTPGGKRFKVVLEDGSELQLDYHESTDEWSSAGSV